MRNPRKGSFARCVEKVGRKRGIQDPGAVCAASKRKAGEELNPASFRGMSVAKLEQLRIYADARAYDDDWLVRDRGRRELEAIDKALERARKREAKTVHNPLDLAAEAFEATHGYPPDERIVIHEREHYHQFLPAWGALIELLIVPEGQRRGVVLRSFDGKDGPAYLAFSEHEKLPQLEIVGGDQGLTVETLRRDFGIEVVHEKEVLGKCVDIVYYTVKTHLGKDGGEANFAHKFAEETARKKLHVRILKSPTATYDTLNKKIGLWGGVYENTPEGIRD